MSNRLIAAGLALVALLMAPTPALADDAAPSPVTWSVRPADATRPDGRAWAELDLEPGQAVTENMAVTNLSQTEVTFRLSAADGYFTGTGRFNMLPRSEPSTAAGTWITLQPEITLAAGETAIVPFVVEVPQNATPGDHAAGVAASVVSASANGEGAQMGVESRIGFRVMIRVSGELAPALDLNQLTASYRTSWNPFRPGIVTITYEAENTGNTQIDFSDQAGRMEPTARGSLLPGESRTVQMDGFSQWPTGWAKTTLTVTLAVPGTDLAVPPATRAITVVAIPWPQLASLAGVALIVIAILSGRRRSRARIAALLAQARAEGRKQALNGGAE